MLQYLSDLAGCPFSIFCLTTESLYLKTEIIVLTHVFCPCFLSLMEAYELHGVPLGVCALADACSLRGTVVSTPALMPSHSHLHTWQHRPFFRLCLCASASATFQCHFLLPPTFSIFFIHFSLSPCLTLFHILRFPTLLLFFTAGQ